MTTVRTEALPRVYPLPAPTNDPRFTAGLLLDLTHLLTAHGYPRPTSAADLVGLQQALFRYLYDTHRETPR